MDIVYVRTKLQALIAIELMESGVISQRFGVVRLFRHAQDEDLPSVYRVYGRLTRHAAFSIPDVEARGFLRSTFVALACATLAWLTGGRIYAAAVGYHPLCLALRATGAALRSLDDGSANVLGGSRYHRNGPIAGGGIGRALLRRAFPNGAEAFFRNRTERHFTIYPGQPNIVPPERLETIRIPWADMLSAEEQARIPAGVQTVLLGTDYADTPNGADLIAEARALGPKIDLYLPHPMEKQPVLPEKRLEIDSPAETILHTLASRNSIRVFHFGSSVALTFLRHPAVELIDLSAAEGGDRPGASAARNAAS